MKVQLVVVQGKPEGMTIPLAGPRYKIGRGENCQLRPNSDLVSREHAEFTVGTDSVLVQDLGSRNGTEVNGKKLAAQQPQILKSGDLIKVGTLTFAISIEGAPAAKVAPVIAGGTSARKKSLDDVSGDEIDAWLVSDESRPTPERPSGVYGGDTITLATYNGQEKDKTKTPPPAAKAAPPPAAKPVPPAPKPAPVVAAPTAPVATAPAPVAPAPVPVAVAQVPEPVVQAPQTAPVTKPVVVAAPAAPAPVVEPGINPLFDFLPDNMPDAEPITEGEEESSDAADENDGIEDLSSMQADDDPDEGSSEPSPEDFIDESNPFYVKKKTAEAPVATKPGVGSQDSSAAAGDILRKLLDRRRASK